MGVSPCYLQGLFEPDCQARLTIFRLSRSGLQPGAGLRLSFGHQVMAAQGCPTNRVPASALPTPSLTPLPHPRSRGVGPQCRALPAGRLGSHCHLQPSSTPGVADTEHRREWTAPNPMEHTRVVAFQVRPASRPSGFFWSLKSRSVGSTSLPPSHRLSSALHA